MQTREFLPKISSALGHVWTTPGMSRHSDTSPAVVCANAAVEVKCGRSFWHFFSVPHSFPHLTPRLQNSQMLKKCVSTISISFPLQHSISQGTPLQKVAHYECEHVNLWRRMQPSSLVHLCCQSCSGFCGQTNTLSSDYLHQTRHRALLSP